MGEVRLNGGKSGQMAFQTKAGLQNQATGRLRRGNLPNDGAIWVTSPWKQSYLGYIG